MPKVSIIIPVYKVEAFIRRCVDSATAQTYRDIEIILVDDGSPDNRGVSAARNAGMDMATGEYTQFLDGDDTIVPEATERLLAAITKDASDMVICGHRRITYGKDGRQISANILQAASSGTFDRKSFLRRFGECSYLVCIGWEFCWDKLISRPFISKHRILFPENMSICEDRIFNLACFERCSRISVIPDILCEHFLPALQQGVSASTNFEDGSSWRSHQKAFDTLSSLLARNDCLDAQLSRAVNQDYFNTMIVRIYRLCHFRN
ncbi:MAG: glycosyltransferase, partial [Victivallales bacterium]|nr:glycosyltransferase [Victivallales bacterium]